MRSLATTWLPATVLAAAGAFLLWSRLIPLGNSLWNDELHSVMSYINPGPSGIWGNYTLNDHMLFEFLSWGTVRLVGNYSESSYRIWGVVPAIAGVTVLAVWAWRRIHPWVAGIFAVLAATSPLIMSLSVQARGYGLGLLASAITLIGAERLARGPSRAALVAFICGALIGIWTLPTFSLTFIILTGLLLIRRRSRRQVLTVFAGVVAASVAFYAPVLGALLTNGTALSSGAPPWHGFVTGPLRDLLAPSVGLLIPALSLTVSEVVAGAALVIGAFVLFRVPERFLALMLLLPAPFAYLVFELAGKTTADRFMSFVALPLLLLAAVGVVGIGWSVATRHRFLATLVLVCGLAFSSLALRRGEYHFIVETSLPIENWREAASLARTEPLVVTNSRYANSLDFYLHKPAQRILDPARLETTICSYPGSFAYVAHSLPPSPQVSAACLVQRHAVEIPMSQLHGSLAVWLVPGK